MRRAVTRGASLIAAALLASACGQSTVRPATPHTVPPTTAPAPRPRPVISRPAPLPDPVIRRTCGRIAKRLASVSDQLCLSLNLKLTGHHSAKGVPILAREFSPVATRAPLSRVLLIGGIHGDELTSVSVVFKWMGTLAQHHSGIFHWRIAPLVNADGLLRRRSTRTNANGVDLNRNFPSPDWSRLATHYWVKQTDRNPRRFPGASAASETETRFVIDEIRRFRPDVIVAVHAPHGLVDYDASDRRRAPRRIGHLRRSLLGTYPGSLGNYAGIHLNIPVVTLELPHAGIMPGGADVKRMWHDLVSWLKNNTGRNAPSIADLERQATLD